MHMAIGVSGVKKVRKGINYVMYISAFTTWVKVFRIIPEFRILRLTFNRKSALKF